MSLKLDLINRLISNRFFWKVCSVRVPQGSSADPSFCKCSRIRPIYKPREMIGFQTLSPSGRIDNAPSPKGSPRTERERGKAAAAAAVVQRPGETDVRIPAAVAGRGGGALDPHGPLRATPPLAAWRPVTIPIIGGGRPGHRRLPLL